MSGFLNYKNLLPNILQYCITYQYFIIYFNLFQIGLFNYTFNQCLYIFILLYLIFYGRSILNNTLIIKYYYYYYYYFHYYCNSSVLCLSYWNTNEFDSIYNYQAISIFLYLKILTFSLLLLFGKKSNFVCTTTYNCSWHYIVCTIYFLS